MRDVPRETDAALSDHLRGRTVAGVSVTLDRDLQDAAVAGLADKQDVEESCIANCL
jgi:hypothetical protein